MESVGQYRLLAAASLRSDEFREDRESPTEIKTEARMAEYADAAGVQTWYDEHGDGEALLLLHPGGAGVDARALRPNLPPLAEHFHVFTPERRGHGRTPDVDGPITFELMAADTIAFLERVVHRPAHVVGCSDGAVVALMVALARPDLVRRLVFVAGVFHRDGWAPGVVSPDHQPPEFLRRLYEEVSPDGPAHYGIVVDKLNEMHARGPTLTIADLRRVATRTLVMLGDDDEVTLEHAVAMYRHLSDGELAVIPGTSHGLLAEKPMLCNTIIHGFLTTDPVPTLAPLLRG